MLRTIFIVAGFAAFLFLSASSQQYAFAQERPCADDISRFCPGVRPGGGKIISCLQVHESDLSTSCREKLNEILSKVEEAKQACAADIGKFCRDVQLGEGRVARCLEQRASELSPVCADKLDFVKEKLKEK